MAIGVGQNLYAPVREAGSWVARVDARAKLIGMAGCVAAGLMAPQEKPVLLAAICVVPVLFLFAAGTPIRVLARRWIGLSPLMVMLAIGCGWPMGVQVILTATLAFLATMAVVTTTPMPSILSALSRLGMPSAVVMQLGMIYRYLFVIRRGAADLVAARALRDAGRGGLIFYLSSWANALGVLFARSLDQSDRVAAAMELRGFTGEFPMAESKPLRREDWVFIAGAVVLPLVCAWARLF